MHLSHHHALALVTLARHLIRADGVISEPELHAMMDMAKTIGLQTFSSALQRTDDMPALTSSQLDGLVDAVEIPMVRRFMFGQLVMLAAADGICRVEHELLQHIADRWHLEAYVPVVDPVEHTYWLRQSA